MHAPDSNNGFHVPVEMAPHSYHGSMRSQAYTYLQLRSGVAAFVFCPPETLDSGASSPPPVEPSSTIETLSHRI
jgi:hypothetical protein